MDKTEETYVVDKMSETKLKQFGQVKNKYINALVGDA